MHTASAFAVEGVVKAARLVVLGCGHFKHALPQRFCPVAQNRGEYAHLLLGVLIDSTIEQGLLGGEIAIAQPLRDAKALRQVGHRGSPAAILFGSNDLEKSFKLRNAGAHGGYEWVEAIPKTKDTPFEKINIGMKNGMPEAMELYDSLGQLSLIKFTKFTKNPPVSASTFKFVTPKGADVFRN